MNSATLETCEPDCAVNQTTPFNQKLGFNKFFLDFTSGEKSARSFFSGADMKVALAQIDQTEYPREELADLLELQNKRFGSKANTFENIQRLTDAETVVVFSGQQAGLFGGPLLGFYKALWAVKTAKKLTTELGRNVLPCFWIAADDHDFEEINHTFVFDMLGSPQRLSYYRSAEEGRPAYQRLFSNEDICEEMTKNLYDSLGKTDFSEEVAGRLCACYHQGADFVTAFGKFMADTLPDLGLILFSPGDDRFKALSAPFYHTILEKHAELKAKVGAANQSLTDSGYHLQVEKPDSACHMFMLTPKREPIHFVDGKYIIGESTLSAGELHVRIDSNPADFSPDVFTRPILSAYQFPTLVQAGGPSEIAYFAQLAGLYELVDRPAPIFSGRISATLIEKRFEKVLKRHDLQLTDFTSDVEQVINNTLGKTFPHDLERRFAEARTKFGEAFDPLAEEVISFNKSLEANAGQIRGKINNALENFEKKAFAAHKRKLADERAAIYRVANALFPERALQERSISLIYYLSRYGYRIIDFLVERLELNTESHQEIHLAEMDKQ